MAFGFDLPDIIEEGVNRIPGVGSLIDTEEEKRRRRRRKKRPPVPASRRDGRRKKDEDDEDGLFGRIFGASVSDIVKAAPKPVRDIGGASLLDIGGVRTPGFLKNIPKDVYTFASGIPTVAGAVGKAGWHDYRALSRPGRKLDRQDLEDFLRLAKWTFADASGDKRKMPKTDSELAGFAAMIIREWGRGIERATPNPLDWEDTKEAWKTWNDHPVFAAMDVLPFMALAGRPVSVAAHARSIGRLNPDITKREAFRTGVKESYVPGAARRKGLKGGIPERIIRSEDLDREIGGRPWSRIPIVREMQRTYDEIYASLPGVQRKRVGRLEERAEREERRLIELAAQEMSAPVARLVYGRTGRLGASFGVRQQMSAKARRRATAVAYAFQNYRHLEPDEALGAVEDNLRTILERGTIEIPEGERFRQVPLRPDERDALTHQVADLTEVRRELRDGDISEDEFKAALEHLGNMAWKTEDMGVEILERFRQLSDEEIDEVQRIWGERASILPRFLSARGHLALELRDSVERSEWLDVLTERFGREKAVTGIAIADAIARKVRPNDPASFYSDRVGRPTRESLEEFLARGAEEGSLFQRLTREYGEQPLVEGENVISPASTTAFYSPLQHYVDEMKPRMQSGQLQAELRKKIPPEELENAGVDNFFEGMARNDLVYRNDFQTFLANRLNAYNLREHHLTNREDIPPGYQSRYDYEHGAGYISRLPEDGEYHEVFFDLPGPTVHGTYKGKARDHWDADNIVAHVRFHVFEEDGRVKLLVDEMQSDWANAFRGVRNRPRMSPEDRIEYDHLRADYEQSEGLLRATREKLFDVERRINEAGPDEALQRELDDEYYALMNELDGLREDNGFLRRNFDAIEKEFNMGNIPPSPLGTGFSPQSSYANLLTRWINRYAAENGVDEIVLVARETQLARNKAALEPSEWNRLLEATTEDVGAAVRASEGWDSFSFRSYGTGGDLHKVFSRELGVPGERSERAYQGLYRYGGDVADAVDGPMPGTVFRLTDESRELAMRPKALYQRTPNWKGIPKGATELLEGRNLIHLFERGDISTWIHELGHSALYDLGADDLRKIEGAMGGGKPLAEWTDMDHERFARAFEQFVRDGKAPTKDLTSTFQRISNWIEEIWRETKQRRVKMDPQVQEVFSRMFDSRPTSSDVETWGYFPHRDFTEIASQEYKGGVRPPAAGATAGVPRLEQKTLQRHENEMILYQTGRLSPDPHMLVDVFMRRQRFLDTLDARDEMWEMGRSLDTKPSGDVYLIRNPHATAERISPQVRATVEGRPTTLPESREGLESLESDLYADFDVVRQEMIAKPGEHPRWATEEENVRWLPKDYVNKRFGEVFEQRPQGSIWSSLGLLTAMQRFTGIYGRPLSYIGGNVPFNVLALMSTMPVSTLRNAPHMVRLLQADLRNPDSAEARLYRSIASQTGETRASGGLPRFYTSAQNRAQHLEQQATQFQRASADVLSKVADSPYRVTAFLNNARKRGFKTDDELRELIEEGGSELSDIRQLTREQLLDFDALNPQGRRLASNLLYLWPFIYASMKWPAMFAREYPVRAGALATAAQESYQDEPGAIANLWLKHGVDFNTLNPMGPLGEIAEQIDVAMQDPSRLNLEFLGERLNPTLAALIEGMSGGKKNAAINFARQTIPGLSEIMSYDPRFRGGKQYADQARKAYLWQRHTRYWPRGVNPEVIKERVDEFRKDRINADTFELQREEDWKKVRRYYDLVGGDGEAIQQSFKAWWDYQELVDEKKDATGQRKLTDVQTAEVLHEVVEEHYPELRGELWDTERMDRDWAERNKKELDEYVEALKKYINEGRTQLFDDHRWYASED